MENVNKKLKIKKKKLLIFISILIIIIGLILIIGKIIYKNIHSDYIIDNSKYYMIKVDYPKISNKEIDKDIDNYIADSIEGIKKIANDSKEYLKENGMKYELNISNNVYDYKDIRYVYLLKYEFTGGAHYIRDDVSYHYNIKTNEQLYLKDFFKENSDYLHTISRLAYFKVLDYSKNKKKDFIEKWVKDGTSPKIENFKHFYFTDKGLNILFPPYQVSSWGDGEVKILIPYNEIKDIINFDIPKIDEDKTDIYKPVKRDLTQFKDKKLVAFTFDDGPSYKITERLLKGLNERNAKATFFVLGNRVKQYPNIVKKTYIEGHTIASHTYSHLNLYNLKDYEIYNEINKTNKIIKKILGVNIVYIREPYGNTNKNIRNISNMQSIMWSVDTEDWLSRDKNKISKKILDNTYDGSIILLHDLYESSVDGALMAMDELSKKGYAFVSIDEMMELKNIKLNKNKVYYDLTK